MKKNPGSFYSEILLWGQRGIISILILISSHQGFAQTKKEDSQPTNSSRWVRTDLYIPFLRSHNQPWDIFLKSNGEELFGENIFENSSRYWSPRGVDKLGNQILERKTQIDLGQRVVSWSQDLYYQGGETHNLVKDVSTGKSYLLSLSVRMLSSFLKNSLLESMGYRVPEFHLVKTVQLQFKSSYDKEAFLRQGISIDINWNLRKWVRSIDEKTVEIHYAILEEVQEGFLTGLAQNQFQESNAVGRADYWADLKGSRIFRGSFLPLQLLDFEESWPLFSPRACFVSSEYAVAPFTSPKTFSQVDQQDIFWSWKILKKIPQSEIDSLFNQFNKLGLPSVLIRYIQSKFLQRVDSWAQCLKVESLWSQSPRYDISTLSETGVLQSGDFQTGLVLKDFPLYFAGTPMDPPWKAWDFVRIMQNQFQWSVVNEGLRRLLESTQIDGVKQMVTAELKTVQSEIIQAIEQGTPYNQPVRTRGANIGGFQFQVNRSFAHSAAYGLKNDRVLVADTLAVALGLGRLWNTFGLEWSPGATISGSVAMQYTYIRPVVSVEEGIKKPVADILIPLTLYQLNDDLKKSPEERLVELAKAMKEGEAFIVSMVTGAQAQVSGSASWAALLGGQALSFSNVLSAGWEKDLAYIWTRVLRRTKTGFEVTLRRPPCADKQDFTQLCNGFIKASHKDTQTKLSLRYWLDIFQITSRNPKDHSDVEVYTFSFDPYEGTRLQAAADKSKSLKDGEKTDEQKLYSQKVRSISETLNYLFFKGSAENSDLVSEIKNHRMAQRAEASDWALKVLWLRAYSLERIFQSVVQPFSKEFQKEDQYRITQVKRGGLVGKDYKAFVEDVVNAAFRERGIKLVLNSSDNVDSSNTPLGSSVWRTITAEGPTLQPKGSESLPNLMHIVHTWGSFYEKRNQWMKYLEEANLKATESLRSEMDPKQKNPFLLPLKLFFGSDAVALMRIQLKGTLFPAGVRNLDQKLNSEKLIEWLAEIESPKDLEKGYAILYEKCRLENLNSSKESIAPIASFRWGKKTYPCLTPWMTQLLEISELRPNSKLEQLQRWTRAMDVLESHLPLYDILNSLGNDNFSLCLNHTGYRYRAEDAYVPVLGSCLGGASVALRSQWEMGLLENLSQRMNVSVAEMNPVLSGDLR